MEIENDANVKKFIREARDVIIKYVSYETIEDAERNMLAEDGPLSQVLNKYIENGTIEQAERSFRVFQEGQCLIPHAKIEVSYLANGYGLWKRFNVTI